MDTIRSFIPGKGWTESAAESAAHPNPVAASTPTNDPAVFRSHFRADGRRLALQPMPPDASDNAQAATRDAAQPQEPSQQAGTASAAQDSAAQTMLDIGESIEHILQALSQERDAAARLGDVVENLRVISQRLEEQQLLEQRLNEVKEDIRLAKAEIPVLLAEARRSDLDLIESAHLRMRVIEELATKMTGAIGQA
jgi:transcription termination factor NusB